MHRKQLRHCSAFVESDNFGNHWLTSYNTLVAAIGYLDGEVVNELTGELIDCSEYTSPFIVLFPDYDYSVTTMSHVRKFVEDYYGVPYTISELREFAKNPLDTGVIMVDC